MRVQHNIGAKRGCVIAFPALFGIALLLFSLPVSSAENRVLQLDGNGGYLELPGNIFNDVTEATVEGWVKWGSIEDEKPSKWFELGRQNQKLEVGGRGFERASELSMGIHNSTGSHQIRVGNILREGQWCHIAAVTGNGGMKLYFNGILVGTNSYTGSLASIKNGDLNYFGKSNDPNEKWVSDFLGQMDEIRVWKVARSQEQIREQMFTQLTGSEPGLVGLWNFDDGSGKASGPGGHHGKLMDNAQCVAAKLPATAELQRPALFSGKITSEDGKPVPWVMVNVEQNASVISSAGTDDTGTYSLAVYPTNELYDLSVSQRSVQAKKTGLKISPGERQEVNLTTKPIISLAGTVLAFDNLTPLVAVVVQVVKPADGEAGASATDQAPQRRDVVATTLTDEHGKFKFIGLKPGQYQVRCHGLGELVYRADGKLQTVGREKPLLNVDFRLAPIKKGAWRSYTQSERVVHSNITCVLTAPDDTIWVGTRSGVSRLNGQEFIRVNAADGLAANQVNALYRDPGGVLWFGTQAGVARYDERNQRRRWTTFTMADGLINNGITAIGRDSAGMMWFATDFGLSRYDGKKFKDFTLPKDTSLKLLSAIECASDGVMWLGTFGNGACRYDGVTWKNFSKTNGLPDDRIQTVLAGDQGTVWFGTGKGAARMQGTNIVTLSRKDGLADDTVYAIHRDPDGVVWFGTGNGLSRYDGKTFVNFATADGLAHPLVRAIARDARGVMWLGTAGGLCSFEPGATATAVVAGEARTQANSREHQRKPQLNPVASGSHAERKGLSKSKPSLELKPKWQVGKRYVYRLEVNESGVYTYGPNASVWRQESAAAQTFALSVVKERERGGRELEFEILALERFEKGGDQVWVDFDSKGDTVTTTMWQDNPVPKVFQQMIGPRIKLLMDRTNKLEKIESYDEFVDKATAKLQAGAKYYVEGVCSKEFLQQIADYGNLLPKTVRPGESSRTEAEIKLASSENAAFDLNFTFTGWESNAGHRCLRLDFSGPAVARTPPPGTGSDSTVKAGKAAGKIWFDPHSGTVVEIQMDQRVFSEGNAPGDQSASETARQATLKLVALGNTRP